jgi:hypothetical protein
MILEHLVKGNSTFTHFLDQVKCPATIVVLYYIKESDQKSKTNIL